MLVSLSTTKLAISIQPLQISDSTALEATETNPIEFATRVVLGSSKLRNHQILRIRLSMIISIIMSMIIFVPPESGHMFDIKLSAN